MYLLKVNSDVLLVGEAPGYKGCKITGIPFTSGAIIKKSEHKIFKKIGCKIHLHQVFPENTATIFWDFFREDKPVPILWNAFPFHPHNGTLESNRKPNSLEIEEGMSYLKTIYDLFKPKTICSIGRIGEIILKKIFPEEKIIYIRHPSHGGKKDFIKGMQKVLS